MFIGSGQIGNFWGPFKYSFFVKTYIAVLKTKYIILGILKVLILEIHREIWSNIRLKEGCEEGIHFSVTQNRKLDGGCGG